MSLTSQKTRGPDGVRQPNQTAPRMQRRRRATIVSATTAVLIAIGLLVGVAAPANAAAPACDTSAWVKGATEGVSGSPISAIYDMPVKFYGGGVVEWRCTMRSGSTGYGVRRLQQTLNDCHRGTTGTWLSVDRRAIRSPHPRGTDPGATHLQDHG